MDDDIRQRLKDAGNQYQELLRQRRIRTELANLKDEEHQKCLDLERRMAREESEIRKLRGHSFSALVHAIMGDRTELLATEERESAVLHMQVEESLTRTETLQDQIKERDERIEALTASEGTYTELLSELDKRVETEGGAQSQELRLVEAEHNELNARLWLLHQAYQVGQLTLVGLQEVQDAMAGASQVMIWNRNDWLSTSRKLDQFEKARRRAAAADQQLSELVADLEALGLAADHVQSLPPHGISGMSFAYLGPVADLPLSTEIERARNQNLAVQHWVEQTLDRLRQDEADTDAALEAVVRRRVALLESV